MTNKELHDRIPKITFSIREQRLLFIRHCWRSKRELVSDCLLWQPLHGQRPRGRPEKTVIDQLSEDTGCTLSELPHVMSD